MIGKRIVLKWVLLMFVLAHIACSKDSGSPSKPAFTIRSGAWSSDMSPQEMFSVYSLLFRVNDDGSALHDFILGCGDASASYFVNPIETIPISGTTFSTTISGDDTEVNMIELPYDITISGNFITPEEANVTVKWGDAHTCTRTVRMNPKCRYHAGRLEDGFSVNLSCPGKTTKKIRRGGEI